MRNVLCYILDTRASALPLLACDVRSYPLPPPASSRCLGAQGAARAGLDLTNLQRCTRDARGREGAGGEGYRFFSRDERVSRSGKIEIPLDYGSIPRRLARPRCPFEDNRRAGAAAANWDGTRSDCECRIECEHRARALSFTPPQAGDAR